MIPTVDTLGNVIRLQRGHDLTETERRSGTVPVVGSAGQNGWHDTARARAPGVTVGRSGASAGVITYCEEDFWPHNTCLYVTDFLGNHPRFISYYLQTLPLMSMNSGSAQQSLNRNFLYSLTANVPLPDEQRRIASILSAYDDLIEVNRRRVAILEEMARRLFEEWFVRLRFPGHETVPAHDTPDGPLPEGWLNGVIGNLLTLHRGYDLASHERAPGDIPIMTGSGVNGTHNAYKIAAPGVVTGRSGTIGGVFLVHENFWPLNTALYVSSFKRVGPTFALFLLRQLDLRTRAGGAAVPTLNRNHVHALPVLQPPVALVEMYERLAAPMLQQTWKLAQQSERLAATRDLLLPRLISGELSVADAPTPARFLEAAE